MNGTTAEMVIRKGGVDNEIVPQSQWNVDRLDGTGPSKVNIDFTKSQIFVTDYQWLGVGRVRFGFYAYGKIHYCHQILNIKSLSKRSTLINLMKLIPKKKYKVKTNINRENIGKSFCE
jgi:hypothetical protein